MAFTCCMPGQALVGPEVVDQKNRSKDLLEQIAVLGCIAVFRNHYSLLGQSSITTHPPPPPPTRPIVSISSSSFTAPSARACTTCVRTTTCVSVARRKGWSGPFPRRSKNWGGGLMQGMTQLLTNSHSSNERFPVFSRWLFLRSTLYFPSVSARSRVGSIWHGERGGGGGGGEGPVITMSSYVVHGLGRGGE